jgi:hypothetical protein
MKLNDQNSKLDELLRKIESYELSNMQICMDNELIRAQLVNLEKLNDFNETRIVNLIKTKKNNGPLNGGEFINTTASSSSSSSSSMSSTPPIVNDLLNKDNEIDEYHRAQRDFYERKLNECQNKIEIKMETLARLESEVKQLKADMQSCYRAATKLKENNENNKSKQQFTPSSSSSSTTSSTTSSPNHKSIKNNTAVNKLTNKLQNDLEQSMKIYELNLARIDFLTETSSKLEESLGDKRKLAKKLEDELKRTDNESSIKSVDSNNNNNYSNLKSSLSDPNNKKKTTKFVKIVESKNKIASPPPPTPPPPHQHSLFSNENNYFNESTSFADNEISSVASSDSESYKSLLNSDDSSDSDNSLLTMIRKLKDSKSNPIERDKIKEKIKANFEKVHYF